MRSAAVPKASGAMVSGSAVLRFRDGASLNDGQGMITTRSIVLGVARGVDGLAGGLDVVPIVLAAVTATSRPVRLSTTQTPGPVGSG